MFYVLTFHDHKFKTCDNVKNVYNYINQLPENVNRNDDIEVIDVNYSDIRYCYNEFCNEYVEY